MALVKPADTATIKLTLPNSIVKELFEYAEWANAPRSRVVRVALERLFEQDEEWQKHAKS